MDINSLSELPNIYNQQYTNRIADSIERITTGLKINDTADDTAAAIISTSLRANSSSLAEGIQNANNGYGLIEVSNKALDYQEEILNKIKDRLELAQTDDATTRDAIRENIQTLIEEFDNIASSTSYNSNYTLQQSKDDNSSSIEISINFTTDTAVTTTSIQSNSEGVNLSDLKNLLSDELTLDEVSTQLTNIDNAIETLNEFKDDFSLTKEELGININNLEAIEEGNTTSHLQLTQANIAQEEVVFDKYKLLVENSSFAISQANITQEAVLDLLTTIPDYVPIPNEDTSTDKDEDEFAAKKDDPFKFEFPENNSDNSFSSSSINANTSINNISSTSSDISSSAQEVS